MKTAILLLCFATLGLCDDVILRAASREVNCHCQCSPLTFRDKYGRINGNCKAADETGAKWCYVDTRYSRCSDLSKSDRYRNYWSYEACATPELGSYQCRGSSGGYSSGSNGGFNTGSNGGFNSGSNGGFNSGSNGGFNSGSNGGHHSGSNGGFNSGSNGGFNSGSNGAHHSGSNGGFSSGSNGGFNSGLNGGFNSGSNGGYGQGSSLTLEQILQARSKDSKV